MMIYPKNWWIPFERTGASFRITKKFFILKQTKFPRTLSDECIIRKVQDLSLQKVVMCF